MVRGVRAASLDDPSWLIPMATVWTCKAYPWEQIDPGLKAFETQPREDEWASIFEEQARRIQNHVKSTP